MDRDKNEQVQRYLRGAAREKVRRENERERAKRGGGRSGGSRRSRGYEDWDDDEVESFERIRKRPSGRSPKAGASAEEATSLVVGIESGRALVVHGGETVEARLAPELVVRGSVVVGDLVSVEELEGGLPRVVAVGPRRNALTRSDPANPHEERVIAANLDLAVIVLAPFEGAVREGMADRIRVALARHGVEDMLVVNKCDLLDEGERERLDRRIAAHAEHGRQALAVSAWSGEGVEPLRAAMAGRTVVFVGPSGVGKSTLLNALDPAANRATGDVREKDGKGRHTTTSSRMVQLAGGARWIDTPGVRQFGLGSLGLDDLRAAFPELVARAADCRFSDCRHLGEEGCAVAEAARHDAHVAERHAAWTRILDIDGC